MKVNRLFVKCARDFSIETKRWTIVTLHVDKVMVSELYRVKYVSLLDNDNHLDLISKWVSTRNDLSKYPSKSR